jgi:Zn-dependent metalloprotease
MRLTYLFLFLLTLGSVQAQFKPHLYPAQSERRTYTEKDILPFQNIPGRSSETSNTLPIDELGDNKISPVDFSKSKINPNLTIYKDPKTGLPIFIEGVLVEKNKPAAPNSQAVAPAFAYLRSISQILQVDKPDQEFVLVDTQTDQLGYTHFKMRQVHRGVEVYGSEINVHTKDGVTDLFNGRYFPTPNLPSTQPTLNLDAAIAQAWKEIAKTEKVSKFGANQEALAGKQVAKSQLVIYHLGGDPNQEKLVWYLELAPQVLSRWAYFIDAQTGAVLNKYNLICHFAPHLNEKNTEAAPHFHTHVSIREAQTARAFADGPATAIAKDLYGVNRTINTYSIGGKFYLIDGSRPMFKLAASKLPDDPNGAIWTLDGGNTSPNKNDFAANHVFSLNNSWNNPNAVSAHYNAGIAYDYFRKVFTRNSINGNGGTIISLINISQDDGTPMDNAYWNGQAMFYGNGNKAFKSLARALDVASHEMSHGVIQNTANLEYIDESGALNESFADVFGMLNDRTDWKMGEDVANPAYFPSGAIRDLSNPHNGGQKGDIFWQPDNVSEKYVGSSDNGGVHINSGITNKAFYLFATQGGLDKAEQVYYRALSNYLTRYSQFIDARLAIVKAAKDIGGDNLAAIAGNSFDAVGIKNGAPTTTKPDQQQNTGSQYVLTTSADKKSLSIFSANGDVVSSPLISEGILSRPSISDDGTLILYVTNLKKIRFITIDWAAQKAQQGFASDQAIWRNVAISKDGNRLAALTDALAPQIYVVDLTKTPSTSKYFNLYNPTYTAGVNSGEVGYADALDWDLTGSYIVYDALNQIKLQGGNPYEYWDIGVIKVFNTKTKTFDTGSIDKIFSGLEAGENVGNPTFSKNSPKIIALDYAYDTNNDGLINAGDDYILYGYNLETGALGELYSNTTIGYPSFSSKDDFIYFNAETNTGTPVVAALKLDATKIIPATGSSPSIFKSNHIWGNYFATGKRVLTSTLDPAKLDGAIIKLYPNPFAGELQLELVLTEPQNLQVEVFDLLGHQVMANRYKAGTGLFRQTLSLTELPKGTYLLRLTAGKNSITQKILKF